MRVGIVGAGTMGTVHTGSHHEAGHQVAAIYDLRPEAAAANAARVGAAVAPTFEALLSDPTIDLIDICLPTPLHRAFVEKAARAGKHVLCEKPLAPTLEDARAMIDICREAGVQFYVAHVLRFFPEYERARNLVLAGKVGEPGVIRTTRGGIFPTGWDDWYADYSRSGTLTLDMIIHDFDWLRWTFGEVERVYAKSLSTRTTERLDYALVTLRFASGAIAHVEGTWSHSGFRYGFEVAGSKGLIDFDSAKIQPVVVQKRAAEAGVTGVAVPESPLRESPYTTEIRHFGRCIEHGEIPIVTAYDAYKAVEISLAALESARTGRPVTLAKEAF
ncbi:MAG: gfo/Idh/MocA family oxidoreductase [Symbiobacteriaceae bacterium]|nr:gfo/Idh/MocA family oxidoreductase [Symbiobacteriaceae bacterium]